MNFRLIAGIGNPEPEYAGTRHNLGCEVVKRLAEQWGVAVERRRFLSNWGVHRSPQGAVGLILPQVFVNNSGFAVKSVCDYFEISPLSVLVVSDDLNLPCGRLRFRKKGSSGGHNGLKSIIDVCSTERFPRLRIGIGAGDGPDAVSHVLGRYEGDEKNILNSAIETGVDSALSWLKNGIDKHINIKN